MDIEAPWVTEMMRTGTCREYETYYAINREYNDQEEEDSEESDE